MSHATRVSLAAVLVLIAVLVAVFALRPHRAETMATESKPGEPMGYYTCSMHPSVRQPGPGQCPICGMDLILVSADEIRSGEVVIDAQRRQAIGVRTATVEKKPMRLEIHAAGRVSYDESAFVDVSVKVGGFATASNVPSAGALVKKGEPLFSMYSPELYAAQREFLLAAKSSDDGLKRAVRERLRLWDVSDEQIAKLEQDGQPQRDITISAPATGYVIERDLVQGSAVMASTRLYRIAPLDRVWMLIDVAQSDADRIAVGQTATATFMDRSASGMIDYIYPALNEATRTITARMTLDNARGDLRPDLYAGVDIAVDLGDRVQIPKSAVLYAGKRRLVFVDLGEGRLQPKEIAIGAGNDAAFEVLDGLVPGDVVVTSGNFLVAAESRIRSAEQYWGGGDD